MWLLNSFWLAQCHCTSKFFNVLKILCLNIYSVPWLFINDKDGAITMFDWEWKGSKCSGTEKRKHVTYVVVYGRHMCDNEHTHTHTHIYAYMYQNTAAEVTDEIKVSRKTIF